MHKKAAYFINRQLPTTPFRECIDVGVPHLAPTPSSTSSSAVT
jgi:hypothetical protein